MNTREMITENASKLLELLAQAQIKINDAVVATRAAEQVIAQLLVAVQNSH